MNAKLTISVDPLGSRQPCRDHLLLIGKEVGLRPLHEFRVHLSIFFQGR